MATVEDLEGGSELCAWFGSAPSFHDATLRALELRQSAESRLVAHTYRMGPEVDGEGYLIQSKQVTITLTIFDLIEVELFEFAPRAFMDGLTVELDNEGTTLSFDASYGVHGQIKAKRVVVTFEPDSPE